jgi:hypothetical protein
MATLSTGYQKLAEKAIANTAAGTLYVRIYGKYNSYSASAGTVNVTTLLQLYLSNGNAYSYGCTWGIDGQSGSGNININGGESNVQNLITSTYNVSTNADGSSKGYTSTASYDIYGASGTLSVSFNTPTVPRQFSSAPTITLQSKTETTLTYKWATSENAKLVKWGYKKDGSDIVGTIYSGSGSASGTFTITGLTANTQYDVWIYAERADSGLGMDSSHNYPTTYNYPYVSAVGTSNLTIGNKQTLTLYNPLSRSVTVKMYKDSTSGTQLYSGTTSGTSLSFTPTASTLYASIPSAKSGKCVYSVVYGSSTKTTSQYTYTINESDCIPTFSNFTYTDTNTSIQNVVGNNQILVDNNSTCKFTISTSNKASAKNSASISKYKFEWGSKSSEATYSSTAEVSSTISASTGNILKVTAIDSRGLSKTITKTITNIAYVSAVVNNVETARVNGVEAKTYLSAKFTIWKGNWKGGSDTSYDNQLKYVGYRVFNGTSWTDYFDITDKVKEAITSSSGTSSIIITLPISKGLEIHADGSSGGFTIGKEYKIQLLIKDGTTNSVFTPSSYQATLQGEITDGKVGLSRYKDSNGDYHYGINGMPLEGWLLSIDGIGVIRRVED